MRGSAAAAALTHPTLAGAARRLRSDPAAPAVAGDDRDAGDVSGRCSPCGAWSASAIAARGSGPACPAARSAWLCSAARRSCRGWGWWRSAMLVVRGCEFRIQNSEFRKDAAGRRNQSRQRFRWRLANVVALMVVALGVMSPWVIRNQRAVRQANRNDNAWRVHAAAWATTDSSSTGCATIRPGFPGVRLNSTGVGRIASNRLTSGGISAEPPEHCEFEWTRWLIGEPRWSDSQAAMDVPASACLYRVGQLWSPLPHKLTADESTAGGCCGMRPARGTAACLRWRRSASGDCGGGWCAAVDLGSCCCAWRLRRCTRSIGPTCGCGRP